MANHKFCPECGYKLVKDYKFCPECGYQLSGKKSENNKKSINKPSDETGKNLNPKIIYGIIIGGIAVITIILFSSGMLDTAPETTSVNQVQNQNSTSSGVDLNSMNEINALEEKVKQNPDDYQSLLHLAHLKNDSGLYNAAIINYKAYLEKFPKDADARVDMGVCYFNLKDYPTAIKEMETALQYSPNHQIALLNLGIVNLAAGDLAKSKEWLQKAYSINPTNDVGQRAEQLLKNH